VAFVDEVKIHVKAGDGGDGCVSFRRERNIPFGGPQGGNGGKGGDVVLAVDARVHTLLDFRYRQHYKAARGGDGRGRRCHGLSSPHVLVKVPLGCVVLAEDKETMLADMDATGKEMTLCRGGRGGLGNTCFKSSINTRPRMATQGEAGEERWVWLRLKLFCDVGLVGMPNAGKSTLLSKVSAARPTIGDYPFTTLAPSLGVVDQHDTRFVMADLPGLIAHAHRGAGLGIRFLSHVERCRCLLHVIDATGDNVAACFDTLIHELRCYGHGLLDKHHVVCLSKIDAIDTDHARMQVKKMTSHLKTHARNIPFHGDVVAISSLSGAGIDDMLTRLAHLMRFHRHPHGHTMEDTPAPAQTSPQTLTWHPLMSEE